MEDDVPLDEKMRRLHAVEALQKGIAAQINQALVGATQEVLVEAEKGGVLTGRTRANKLVHWPRPSGVGDAAPGDLVNVRITRASPWALRGVQAQAAVPA
jgi:tRNA-2-methylthio-N6-dimethylallyladenosine synthase